MMTPKQINDIAAASYLATAKVFLGPQAEQSAAIGITRKTRGDLKGLGAAPTAKPKSSATGGSATKYMEPVTPSTNKTVDENNCARGGPYASQKLGSAFVSELEQAMMRYGMMQGRADPWIIKLSSEGVPKATDAAWPWLMNMAFADPKQVYDIWLPRFGFDKLYFKDCQTYINKLAVERRGTPGGIIGKILSKTLVPVAKTVEENPALLFAAPLAVWGASTLITGGAAAGSATAAAAPAASAVPTSAIVTPTALTATTPVIAASAAPVVASAVPAAITAAAGGGALSTAATVASAAGAAQQALSGAETAGAIVKAKEIAPKIVEGVNTARTVAAVANGEIPPPPISIGDGNLVDWATAIADQYVQHEMSEREKELVAQRIAEMQAQTSIQAPMPTMYQPSSQLPPEVTAAMAQSKQNQNLLIIAAILGGAFLLVNAA